MDKCCISDYTPRLQRRINGLQLPLNYQQVIAWIVFVVTALLNFIILVEIQFYELKMISIVTYVILYVSHIGSHAVALLTDPSEKELRKLKINNVPEFDRSVHAHVIENGRCHLCNIYTSSRNTKHCSICNKCVDHFDHHCKWLNNCVGQRNYSAFITCVITALLIAVLTCTLCLTDIVLFLGYPEQLSSTTQYFVNCSSVMDTTNFNKYCKKSITFLTFLIIFCVTACAIACALLHLCCFHIYISIIGVSTYEYIVQGGTTLTAQSSCNKCNCPMNWNKKLYVMTTQKKEQSRYQRDNIEAELEDKAGTPDRTPSEMDSTGKNKISHNNGGNVTNLISVLITTELNRAKRIFLYDKNKIRPHDENTTS